MRNLRSLVLAALVAVFASAGEPNPPHWPSSVKIIDPNNPGAGQSVVNQVFAENGGHGSHGQWSNSRYALFFKPGSHQVDVKVGYYTSVYGLGKHPSDTKLRALICENGSTDKHHGALSNFWRSAENFETSATKSFDGHHTTLWAVSQAAPIRRAIINGPLDLSESGGYSSGGFIADVKVTDGIYSGSQQQFMYRNVEMGSYHNGVWNMVFVGCRGAPGSHCSTSGGAPYTNVASSPLIAEKPYITTDGSRYYLQVPRLESNKEGVTRNFDNAEQIDFSEVYVATASDSANTINSKLAAGLHLVLSPGIYNLHDSIKVNNANTVVLGLGMATLVSASGRPAIQVGNVDGVRIAGVLLQAGPSKTEALLLWGSGSGGSQSNPGVLSDVFARVGGTNDPNRQQMTADVMVKINNGNVIYDNSWLWRADHGVSGEIYNSVNYVKTGLQVNGDNVIAYGLASEHTLGNLVEWNGNNGHVYFYQSEYPYDVSQQNYGDRGYVSYKVNDRVTSHYGYGIGVYSFFRDHYVDVKAGILAPTRSQVKFTNSLSVFLTGKGKIDHVIDSTGNSVSGGGQKAYVCQYDSEAVI